jgi:hypothetical protein
LHEFLHLDGKIFRTLWLLIARAGFLTSEYWQGRRTSYIRPLRLYIFIAAIHAIAMSHSFYRVDLFKTQDRGRMLERVIEQRAKRTGLTVAAVEEQINQKLGKAYSIAQYFGVLGFALFPWMLYKRRRPYYIQHLIFALHVYCFYFVLTAAVSPFLTAAQWQRSPLPLVTLAYIVFALRRLYLESWWSAIWKAVALRFGLFLTEFAVLSIALTYAIAAIKGS